MEMMSVLANYTSLYRVLFESAKPRPPTTWEEPPHDVEFKVMMAPPGAGFLTPVEEPDRKSRVSRGRPSVGHGGGVGETRARLSMAIDRVAHSRVQTLPVASN